MSTTQAQPDPADPVTLITSPLLSDLARTRTFYCDVLGMHEISRPADFIFPGAYFKRGTAQVHVVVETTPGRTAELPIPLVCRRTTNRPLRPFCVRGPVTGHLPRHLRRQRSHSRGRS